MCVFIVSKSIEPEENRHRVEIGTKRRVRGRRQVEDAEGNDARTHTNTPTCKTVEEEQRRRRKRGWFNGKIHRYSMAHKNTQLSQTKTTQSETRLWRKDEGITKLLLPHTLSYCKLLFLSRSQTERPSKNSGTVLLIYVGHAVVVVNRFGWLPKSRNKQNCADFLPSKFTTQKIRKRCKIVWSEKKTRRTALVRANKSKTSKQNKTTRKT